MENIEVKVVTNRKISLNGHLDQRLEENYNLIMN